MDSPVFSRAEPFNRRRLLLGAAALGACGGAVGTASVLFARGNGHAVSLTAYRLPGDRDDSESLFRAAASGHAIHAPAGGGSGPEGRYMIAMTAEDDLPSGFTLFGDGIGKTIFSRSYARQAPFLLHADSRSADPRDNLTAFHLRGFSLEDDVVKRGFSEFDYLVMLSGVTGAVIEQVEFRGFRGDGLYIGSSTIRAQERHNRDVRVAACRFDGINANNRNAISIVDCDGMEIEDCDFVNVSRTGGPGPADPMNPRTGPQMPGAIDVEPEDTGFARVRNITIRGNRFSGGGGYAVTLNLLPGSSATAPNQGFRIEGNEVSDRWGGFSAGGFAGDAALSDGAQPFAITVSDNAVRRCEKPFLFDGMRGLAVARNRFSDCAQQGELGYRAANAEVTLAGNVLERIGHAQGFGLWIRQTDQLRIVDNDFIDCGLRDGSRGIPIAFVDGVSRHVAILGNRIENRTGRTTEASTIFRDARLDRSTLKIDGNRIVGKVVRGPAALF